MRFDRCGAPGGRDALIRNTGIAIDPSGNVWLTNNWKPTPLVNNPGDNSIVVLIGAAAPVSTPR